MKAPFPIDPDLTQIAVAYRNRNLIADSVLPRVGVGSQEFEYSTYDKAERYTVPDTNVGRRSAPNEVEFGRSEATGATRDYALEDPIPNADIENAPANYSPVEHAVEAIQDLIALDRELRTANLVFDSSQYGSNTSSPANAWNSGSGTPIADILDALDSPLMRPNVLVFGQQAWRTLSTANEIIKAVHGNSGDAGVASKAQVAALFEVDEVLVGLGRSNTSAEGQTPTFSRVWGDNVAAIYRNANANQRNGITFGLTFQWGDRIAGQIEDPDIGMRGGVKVRSGESVVEKIIAQDTGYLITTPSS